MAHYKKFTRATIHKLFDHYDRTLSNNFNKNIDSSRTHYNYNLATHQTLEQNDFLKKRLSEVKVQNRKDVNVVCSWVVTIPKDFQQNVYNELEEQQFFQEVYNFLENKYGRENVISAWVHYDETTPHVHFAFVPVVREQKNLKKLGIEKVSAKECVTRKDLENFHKELQNHLEKAFDRKINILNGATVNGNVTIQELKLKNQKEEFETYKQNELDNRNYEIFALDAKKQALERREEDFNRMTQKKHNDLLKREYDASEREKTLKSKENELENKQKQYKEGVYKYAQLKKSLDEKTKKIENLENIKISVDDIKPPKKLESASAYYTHIKSFVKEKLETIEKLRKTLNKHIRNYKELEEKLNERSTKLDEREKNINIEVDTRVSKELARQKQYRSERIDY